MCRACLWPAWIPRFQSYLAGRVIWNLIIFSPQVRIPWYCFYREKNRLRNQSPKFGGGDGGRGSIQGCLIRGFYSWDNHCDAFQLEPGGIRKLRCWWTGPDRILLSQNTLLHQTLLCSEFTGKVPPRPTPPLVERWLPWRENLACQINWQHLRGATWYSGSPNGQWRSFNSQPAAKWEIKDVGSLGSNQILSMDGGGQRRFEHIEPEASLR